MKAVTKRHIRDGILGEIQHTKGLITLFSELHEDTLDEQYQDIIIKLEDENRWLLEELKDLIHE